LQYRHAETPAQPLPMRRDSATLPHRRKARMTAFLSLSETCPQFAELLHTDAIGKAA
jgi:hypothetical protein